MQCSVLLFRNNFTFFPAKNKNLFLLDFFKFKILFDYTISNIPYLFTNGCVAFYKKVCHVGGICIELVCHW